MFLWYEVFIFSEFIHPSYPPLIKRSVQAASVFQLRNVGMHFPHYLNSLDGVPLPVLCHRYRLMCHLINRLIPKKHSLIRCCLWWDMTVEALINGVEYGNCNLHF